ncbi:hypothetical protein MLC59_02610 [Marinobacter bryozoorum]|uniref:hypothetical protein n=1 Tax=Marinobacter bryozoorum TaxID=256324 RepID=UPI0020033529|nr:hypothetical protein [Marinobacter bryozoorum]MCK7543060.1 hypothetical protein [Marinobacter bryozoorum]
MSDRITEAVEVALILKYRQHGTELDPSVVSDTKPEKFLAALMPASDRDDICQHSLAAFDAFRDLFSRADDEGTELLPLDLFRAGIAVGRVLESSGRALSPIEEAELVTRDHNSRKAFANLDHEGREALYREATGFAIAYLELIKNGQPMRLDELADVTLEHLIKNYSSDSVIGKHIGNLSRKGVREIIAPRLPSHLKRSGGRPKKGTYPPPPRRGGNITHWL